MQVSQRIRNFIYPIWNIYADICPVSATKLKYRLVTGKKLNLKNPKTFNEKIQWLKLFYCRNNSLVTQCSDKYAVRQFVRDHGCGDYLNEIYGVWDCADDIEWKTLPEKYVLKCNHGSGQNIICDKNEGIDREEIKSLLKKWMKEDYGRTNVELIYKGIPKKIIAERYIETEDKLPPKDYKFFCSYGKPILLFVASDRYDDQTKFDYYTPEWEWIPVKNNHPNAGKTQPPDNLTEMLEVSKKLSGEFPMVRVDLYSEFGRILFGELTFLHFGGSAPFDPEKYDRIFGDLFSIENLMKKKRI